MKVESARASADCYQGFSRDCTAIGTVSVRVRNDEGQLHWASLCDACAALIADERTRDGRCALCFESNEQHDKECPDRWLSWKDLVPDAEDAVAYEAAVIQTQNGRAPTVTMTFSPRGSGKMYIHGWPPRKINVSFCVEDARLILAKSAVQLARGPLPMRKEPAKEEFSLDEIMTSALESERFDLKSSLENNDTRSAEEIVLKVLERAYPSCPKCSSFARRTAQNLLRCFRCGYEAESRVPS